MTTTYQNPPTTNRQRRIGPVGTVVRLLVGLVMVWQLVQVDGDFPLWSWILGLVGFPAVLLSWQRWRIGRRPSRLQATGPLAHVINIGIFLVLYSIEATSDAALVFYGTSMLLAALRGYAGCEVLAVSNWLLRRDDQIGCLLFSPVDMAETQVVRRLRS
jgi:hypothetical protein